MPTLRYPSTIAYPYFVTGLTTYFREASLFGSVQSLEEGENSTLYLDGSS